MWRRHRHHRRAPRTRSKRRRSHDRWRRARYLELRPHSTPRSRRHSRTKRRYLLFRRHAQSKTRAKHSIGIHIPRFQPIKRLSRPTKHTVFAPRHISNLILCAIPCIKALIPIAKFFNIGLASISRLPKLYKDNVSPLSILSHLFDFFRIHPILSISRNATDTSQHILEK